MEVRFLLRTLAKWLAGVMIFAIALGGFMSLDRLVLHWYVPDTGEIRECVSDLSAAIAVQDKSVSGLRLRVKNLEGDLKGTQADLERLWMDTHYDFSDLWDDMARLRPLVAVLSLSAAYGGVQTATSPAARACLDYLMIGTGSMADCGFPLAE